MKKRIIPVLCLLLLNSIAFAQQVNEISIIPKPASVEKGIGSFIISKRTNIVAKGADAEKVAGMFNYFLNKKYGFVLKINNTVTTDAIVLNTTSRVKLPDEAYQLKITNHSINISGECSGVFYGVQSLLQLIHENSRQLSVAAVTINDAPNFA